MRKDALSQIEDVADALDFIKSKKGLKDSAALARFLGVSEGTISNVYTGKSAFSEASLKKYLDNNGAREYKSLLSKFIGSKTKRKKAGISEDKLDGFNIHIDTNGSVQISFNNAADIDSINQDAVASLISTVKAALDSSDPRLK